MGRPAGADDHPTTTGRSTAIAQSCSYMSDSDVCVGGRCGYPQGRADPSSRPDVTVSGLRHLARPFGGVALGELQQVARCVGLRVGGWGVSRSGLPILARGRNEKPPDYSFSPRLCTVQRMRRLRRSGQLDFFRDIYPWILAEITSIFCHAEISATDPVSAERFLEPSRISGRPALRTKRCGRWAGSTASCGNYRHCNPWRGRSRVGDMPLEPEVAVHRVHAVERLPRSVNGKIQRRRLVAGLGDDRAHGSPRGERSTAESTP